MWYNTTLYRTKFKALLPLAPSQFHKAALSVVKDVIQQCDGIVSREIEVLDSTREFELLSNDNF